MSGRGIFGCVEKGLRIWIEARSVRAKVGLGVEPGVKID